MVMSLPQARQDRATESRCLKLPESFPTPRFSFGDWVKTDEDDVGMIVGMCVFRLGPDAWWMYELDITIESPNFWSYQACEDVDSPACLILPEKNLTPFCLAEEG